jgi:hypothetical protein
VLGVGAVRFCVVCDLVAHARRERERSPVFEFGVKFTFRDVPKGMSDICTNGSFRRKCLTFELKGSRRPKGQTYR